MIDDLDLPFDDDSGDDRRRGRRRRHAEERYGPGPSSHDAYGQNTYGGQGSYGHDTSYGGQGGYGGYSGGQETYAGQGGYGQDGYGQAAYTQEPYGHDQYGHDAYGGQGGYAQPQYAQDPYAQDQYGGPPRNGPPPRADRATALRRRRKRRRKRGAVGWRSPSPCFFCSASAAAFTSLMTAWPTTSSRPTIEGEGSGEVTVVIPQGANGFDMAKVLVDAGVVKSTKAFTVAFDRTPTASQIQPGTYKLRKEMSGAAAVTLLLDPEEPLGQAGLTILEGWSTFKIYKLLAEKLKLPEQDFKAAAADPVELGVPPEWFKRKDGKPEHDPSIEGFLFPDTYEFPPRMSRPRARSDDGQAVPRRRQADELHQRSQTSEGVALPGV